MSVRIGWEEDARCIAWQDKRETTRRLKCRAATAKVNSSSILWKYIETITTQVLHLHDCGQRIACCFQPKPQLLVLVQLKIVDAVEPRRRLGAHPIPASTTFTNSNGHQPTSCCLQPILARWLSPL